MDALKQSRWKGNPWTVPAALIQHAGIGVNWANPQNILEATDGLEAIETVKSKSIDLMLLDMEMPELDGLGVLEALKSDEVYKSLPIIVISGAEQFDKTIKCIEIGAEDYLPKPFDPILLRARIFSSLEKKRLRDLDQKHMEMLKNDFALEDGGLMEC